MWSLARTVLVASALLTGLGPSLAACDGGSKQPSAGNIDGPPPAETVRDCPSAIYGEEINPRTLGDAVVAGPLTLAIEAGWADRPARAFEPEWVLKVLAIVRAGESMTLVVPEAEQDRLSLLYDVSERGPRRPLRLSDGSWSVRFSACTSSEEWIPGKPYPDPQKTQFNGGFFVRGAHCASLDVWADGQEETSAALASSRDGRSTVSCRARLTGA
jgi:hypothetical protein